MKKQKKVEKNILLGLNCRGGAQGTGRALLNQRSFEQCSKNCFFFKPLLLLHTLFVGKIFLALTFHYKMALMSSPLLNVCINVGFREASCKKSFCILASFWPPPQN